MKKKSKNLLVLIVLLAIIGIAVGYAALGQRLTLNGTASTKGKTDWDVHFADLTATESEKGVMYSDYKLDDDNLKGTFEATLIPGGEIVYTVKVVNDGTIAAEASGNPKATLTGDGAEYFTCEVTPAVTGTIKDGNFHTYKVTLKYTKEGLPENAVEAQAEVEFNYVQGE